MGLGSSANSKGEWRPRDGVLKVNKTFESCVIVSAFLILFAVSARPAYCADSGKREEAVKTSWYNRANILEGRLMHA